jgi:hypothetical protein
LQNAGSGIFYLSDAVPEKVQCYPFADRRLLPDHHLFLNHYPFPTNVPSTIFSSPTMIFIAITSHA